MEENLSSEHKITERIYIKYQPFGVDNKGKMKMLEEKTFLSRGIY